MPLPNRVVAYATALIGLLGALIPLIENYDWESESFLGGFGLIAIAAYKWLDGWQKYEERQDLLAHPPE